MRPSALRAISGGFVATVAITAVMYWVAPLLLGSPMDIARTLAGGAMAVVASLIGHMIYGATLGAIAGGEHAVVAMA